MARDIFNILATAKTFKRSGNIEEGSGLLVVNELIYDELEEGLTFIAEMKVVEVTPAPGAARANRVGETVGYVQKIDKFKSAAGNATGFICTLLGMDSEEAGADPEKFSLRVKKLISDSQPARGHLIRYETYRQATKAQKAEGRGGFNAYPRFTNVPENAGNSETEVAERRKKLEG